MTKQLTIHEKNALNILALINERGKEYLEVNKNIRNLQGDFSAHIQLLDPQVEIQIVNLLDTLLGDELASYYLFEIPGMKEGGAIFPNPKRFPKLKYSIKNIKDIERYILDRKTTQNFTRGVKNLILNKK